MESCQAHRALVVLSILSGCSAPAPEAPVLQQLENHFEPTVPLGSPLQRAVIGKLVYRDVQLVIRTDREKHQGIRFGLYHRDGRMLCENLTEAELDARAPGLRQIYRQSVARDQAPLDARLDPRYRGSPHQQPGSPTADPQPGCSPCSASDWPKLPR